MMKALRAMFGSPDTSTQKSVTPPKKKASPRPAQLGDKGMGHQFTGDWNDDTTKAFLSRPGGKMKTAYVDRKDTNLPVEKPKVITESQVPSERKEGTLASEELRAYRSRPGKLIRRAPDVNLRPLTNKKGK